MVSTVPCLAKKGVYYLMRIKSPKYGQVSEIELEGDGPYHVDLIDPWLKTYKLGYSRGGMQAFATVMAPCLFRFEKVRDAGLRNVSASVQQLIAKFVGDIGMAKPPNAVRLESKVEYFSAEFTLGELLDDDRTKPLVEKYLPNLPRIGFIRARTVEQLEQFSGTNGNAESFGALRQALQAIPVHRQ
jgi:hypothetical protein